ncbi:chitin deacetylase [Entomortierella beljakovae]|nr:chitin deacetylase [Entomortierella beljakovae]
MHRSKLSSSLLIIGAASLCLFLCSDAVPTSSSRTLKLSDYPPLSAVPPVDSTQVKKWLSEIDLSGVPTISLNTGEPPDCPAAVDEDVCYWTCDDCSADDVVDCPDKNAWGLTFDDGPTPDTPELLRFLDKENTKATFFLIGSNVVQYPDLVREELKAGHHLASHTWSHHALTTLTNEQIVAEIKWTEKAIEDATGHRIRYMRPPYGDVDNRVRHVLRKLGYIVVDWTGDTFDSEDWKMPELSSSRVIANFQKSISRYTSTNSTKSNDLLASTRGFISLEHDLSAETVAIAKTLIPFGKQHNLQIMTVAQCLHDNSPYSAINGNPMAGTGTNSSVSPPNPESTGKSPTNEIDGLDIKPHTSGAIRSTGSVWTQNIMTSSNFILECWPILLGLAGFISL